MKNIKHISLVLWVLALISIGGGIGYLTKPEINTWYNDLNRASITPANYIFPIAWTILYGIIGVCGWLIWHNRAFPRLQVIKTLYITQLFLNWSWTPVFFYYHLTGVAFMVVTVMDVLVCLIIWLAYGKLKWLSQLMFPYLLWILFASYLNFHIWWYN